MKRPSRIREPSLGERLGRLLPAAVIPGALPVEAVNQVMDSRPIPSTPTPNSAPRSVVTPPPGTPLPSTPSAPVRSREEVMARYESPLTTDERLASAAPDFLRAGTRGIIPQLMTIYQQAQSNADIRRGPTPGSQTQTYSLPQPPAQVAAPTPLPIASPEVIELVRAVNRGDITLEQAEEFARGANRSETLDKSGVSALLRAAQERRSQNAG